ncbi:hypothetical protein CAPTEDRAFT_220420 [Capitella teleta]|uniref:F5/8 type C domain-containing protein n=1 Tax=Capitella teleta TaxID=283909 RepID=R7V584_CAPTE|nr:hypothetical protein CAPTEDRAFT_220420 [Capitella teleta]|eukprot:ELU13689.1 hypothetical protein CAPTEDRAFT_220420 [Capitella teleta]
MAPNVSGLLLLICAAAASSRAELCKSDESPMINGPDGVANSQLTASSNIFNSNFESYESRLTGSMGWCWDTINGDPDPWLQVDFEYSKPIIAIDTLGHSDVNVGAWVASYEISYSQDGSQWTWYKNNGNVKVFNGNTDSGTFVRNNFNPPIVARFLKFHPLAYTQYPVLRWELYTCNTMTPVACQCSETSPIFAGLDDGGSKRVVVAFDAIGSTPGHDPQSSQYSHDDKSWRSEWSSSERFLTATFPVPLCITGIQSWGDPNTGGYVTSYDILSSPLNTDDALRYKTSHDGNTDSRNGVFHHLIPLWLNSMTIKPKNYSTFPDWRWELYGCQRQSDEWKFNFMGSCWYQYQHAPSYTN